MDELARAAADAAAQSEAAKEALEKVAAVAAVKEAADEIQEQQEEAAQAVAETVIDAAAALAQQAEANRQEVETWQSELERKLETQVQELRALMERLSSILTASLQPQETAQETQETQETQAQETAPLPLETPPQSDPAGAPADTHPAPAERPKRRRLL